jgi:TonB family protein
MTARMMVANIASFGLQVTVLVAVGAALARAFRLDGSRAMLAYWRTLLFACLVLPFCQPWNTVVPPSLAAAQTVVTAGTTAAAAEPLVPAAPRSVAWPISDLVLIALAAGIAARGLWLTIGAFGLRRLRLEASPFDPLPESVRDAQDRMGTRAGIYVSDRISGPITFGLFRPVIMFPPSVSAMPAHVQSAIVYHELLHVRRRDWVDEVLEEIVRSLLWFHPAIWWLIGRVRLTREQVVDEAAIRLTDSRERYVESLLAVARAGSPAAFRPASPFLRRHLLKKRVARILQEKTMTTRRLIASLAASAVALALAATFAVRSFPLEAQGRVPAADGDPIHIIRGGEHLLHGGAAPEYPRRAVEQKIEGDVVVDMTLNDRGEVSDARVVSGPEELRKTALETVLQWHYSPSVMRSTVTQATLRFHLPPAGLKTDLVSLNVLEHHVMDDAAVRMIETEKVLMVPDTTTAQRVELEAKYADTKEIVSMRAGKAMFEVPVEAKAEKLMAELSGDVVLKIFEAQAEKPLDDLFEGAPRLIDVRTERVGEAAAKEVLAQAGVKVGDVMTVEAAKRIREAALAMDEHFRVDFQVETRGLVVTILTR